MEMLDGHWSNECCRDRGGLGWDKLSGSPAVCLETYKYVCN